MSATTNESSSTLSETYDSSTEYTVSSSDTSSKENTSATNTKSSSLSHDSSAYVAEAGYPAPVNSNSHQGTQSKRSFEQTFDVHSEYTLSDVHSSINGKSADSTNGVLNSEWDNESAMRSQMQQPPSESGSSSTISSDASASSIYSILYAPLIVLGTVASSASSVMSYVWGATPQSDEDQNHHHTPDQNDHQFQNNRDEIRQEVNRDNFFIEDDMQSVGTVPPVPSVATPSIPDNSRPSRSQSRPSSPPSIPASSLKLKLTDLPSNPYAWDPDHVMRFFLINVDWLMNLQLQPTYQEVVETLVILSIDGETLLDPELFNEKFLKEDLEIGKPLARKRLMKLVKKLRDTYGQHVISTQIGHIAQGNIGVTIQQGNGNVNNVNNIGSLFLDNSKQINHHYAVNQGPSIVSVRRATFYKGVDYVICHNRWEAICMVKGQKFIIPKCQGQNEKDVAQRLRKECKKLIQEGHQLDPDNGALCILIDSETKALRDGWKEFEEAILENGHILPIPEVIKFCNSNALELSSTISVQFSSPNTDKTDPFYPLDPVHWLKFSTLMCMATNTTTKVYWQNLHFELRDFESLEEIVKQVPRLNQLEGLSMEKLRVFSIEDYAEMKSKLQACRGDFFSTWEFDSKSWRLVHKKANLV